MRLIVDKKVFGQLFRKIMLQTYQNSSVKSLLSELWVSDFPEVVEKTVKCEAMETNSTAKSLSGTPVHCFGVLRISLGTAIQAFSLRPSPSPFPSCSHGEASF